MKIHSDLIKIRNELIEKDKCEFEISESDYHTELVNDISNITNKMNEEKIKAIRDIEEKYIEELHRLQSEYALYIKLNS